MGIIQSIGTALRADGVRGHALRGGLATAGAVFAADTLLPREGEKSDLVGAKLVKEAVVLGAAAGLVISRHDPKAVAFGWSMVGGLVAADGVHALTGSPRFVHYASEHEAAPVIGPGPATLPSGHGTD